MKKTKKSAPHECSTSQIMSRAQKKKKKDEILALPFNSKTHSTLKDKIFVTLYAEDLYFLTTRAGWKVTEIYDHYTFKQDTFKKDFVIMNQNARKTAKTKVEKDFYKLLNNSNFGNDCRNNIGNCKLELMFDGLDEIAYIKKYANILLDNKYKEFFSIDLLRQQVEKEFEKKKEKLNKDDPFYGSVLEVIERKKEEDLEAIAGFERKKKKRKMFMRPTIDTIENKIKNCADMRKNKMVIEFNDSESSSVKSIAVKSTTNIKCTTRFMSGKLLMFAKLSLKSFIYSIVELLTFPEENSIVSKIYEKYDIGRILCYHVLTDTDSTSLQFIIVSDPSSTFPECDVRDILFEIFLHTEMRDRFDKSDEFWKKFDVHKPQNQKVLGLYEVENINDPCYVTLAVNPKEYLEYFKSDNVNKKHKGIKKGAVGMDFENYAERIKPLFDFETYKQPKPDTKQVVRISVKKGEMTTHKITKTKFSQLNDKRFYFPNAIVSLPFGHAVLKEIDDFKKNKGQRVEKYFWKEKEKLLKFENAALKKCERLNFLNNILLQVPKIVSLTVTKFDRNTKFLYNRNLSVLDFILSAGWKTNNTTESIPTKESLKGTSLS